MPILALHLKYPFHGMTYRIGRGTSRPDIFAIRFYIRNRGSLVVELLAIRKLGEEKLGVDKRLGVIIRPVKWGKETRTVKAVAVESTTV